jgi:hypothetical protein
MKEIWKRVPEHDRRFARGDDFAGDAWQNMQSDEIKYVAVGHAPSHPMFDVEEPCERCDNTGWLPEIEGRDGSYITSRPCKCEAGNAVSRLS